MIRFHEDVPLCSDVCDLLLLKHVRLPKDFHCVHVSSVLLLHESHLFIFGFAKQHVLKWKRRQDIPVTSDSSVLSTNPGFFIQKEFHLPREARRRRYFFYEETRWFRSVINVTAALETFAHFCYYYNCYNCGQSSIFNSLCEYLDVSFIYV